MPCQTHNFQITAKTIWHGIYTVLANRKIMDEIFEYKYEISVKVKHQLTDEELNMIKRDFWARLQGYHTECPEQLIDADIEIRGKRE